MAGSISEFHEIKNVSVEIPVKNREKIQFYVDNCETEVGGMGLLVWEARKDTLVGVVKEVYCLSQEVTASTTDLDAEAVADLVYDTRNEEGSISYWWHSHVEMGVFWSDTDMKAMKEMLPEKDGGKMIAGVFNKHREMNHAYLSVPSVDEGPGIFIDNIKLIIKPNGIFSSIEEELMLREIEEKLREKKVVYPKYKYGNYQGIYPENAFDENEIVSENETMIEAYERLEWEEQQRRRNKIKRKSKYSKYINEGNK